EWIEMRLRARENVHVHVGALDLEVDFTAGEEVRTEISAKFRREGLADELETAGFAPGPWWTDPDGDFALTLATAVHAPSELRYGWGASKVGVVGADGRMG